MLNRFVVLVSILAFILICVGPAFAASDMAYVEIEHGEILKIDKKSTSWIQVYPSKKKLKPGEHGLNIRFFHNYYDGGPVYFEAYIGRNFEASKKYIARFDSSKRTYFVEVHDVDINDSSDISLPSSAESKTSDSESKPSGGCTNEMIIKLVRAGMSDEDIKKLCP